VGAGLTSGQGRLVGTGQTQSLAICGPWQVNRLTGSSTPARRLPGDAFTRQGSALPCPAGGFGPWSRRTEGRMAAATGRESDLVRLRSVEPGVTRDNRGSSRIPCMQLKGCLASSTGGRSVPYDEVNRPPSGCCPGGQLVCSHVAAWPSAARHHPSALVSMGAATA
jgi:hypothetical protein